MSISNLLDTSLSELADLPTYENPKPGIYRLSVKKAGVEQIGDKEYIKLELRVVEAIKAAVSGEDLARFNGSEFSVLYNVDNEFGLGALKATLTPFAQSIGTSGIGQTLMAMKDTEFAAEVKNKADKKDPEKIYVSIHNVVIN